MILKKKINKDFFKKWSYDMSYILGFLFADGNITINQRGAHYFSFYSMDKDILCFVRKSMASTHKISKRNETSGNVFRLQIGNKEMVEDLCRLGLTKTKARRMKLPNVPQKHLNSFISGFFDGDGNVWVGKVHKERKTSTIVIQTAFTSASVDFLKELHIKLKTLGVCRGFIYKIKDKECYRLILSVKDTLQLSKIMYNSKYHSFCLKRKKRVFDSYINNHTRP